MGSPAAREDGTAHRGVIASTAGPARRAVACRPATGVLHRSAQRALRAQVPRLGCERWGSRLTSGLRPLLGWLRGRAAGQRPHGLRGWAGLLRRRLSARCARPPGRRPAHRGGDDRRTRGVHRRRRLLRPRLRLADLDRRSDDGRAGRDHPRPRCDAEAADRLLRGGARGDRRPGLRRRERRDPPRGGDRRRRHRRRRERRPPRCGAGHAVVTGNPAERGRDDRRAHRAPRGELARRPRYALGACPTRSERDGSATALGAGRGYVD